MRKAVRPATRRAVSAPVSIPAPVKGWMTSESLASMKPDSAVLLDNWYPETDSVRPRGGSALFASGLGPAPVETLMTFRGGDTERVFAACGPSIFDVSTGAPATIPITGFRSARWQHLNFPVSGGPQLLAFNGIDVPLRFDGTTWGPLIFTLAPVGGIGPSAPFDATQLIGACAYADRLFLIAKGGTTIYYPLLPDSFGGDLGTLAVGGDLARGGALIAISRWTHDAGQGPQDTLVAVSDQGEVVVYQGTNPSNTATWAQIGKFDIAAAVGRRGLVKLGGDLGILTMDGLQPMSKVMTLDRSLDDKVALSANIRSAIKDATARYGSLFGWQVHAHREKGYLLINVPKAQNTVADQLVMNIATGAWSRFTGLNAVCWASFGGKLLFGAANGRVIQADTGFGDLGQPTAYPLISAFTAIKGRGSLKQSKLMRAVIMSNVPVSLAVGVCTDYVLALPGAAPNAQDSGAARWDSARWNVSRWGSAQFGAPQQAWAAAPGIGNAFAPAAYLTLDGTTPAGADIRLVAFDLLLEVGGLL
ncbi:hypothetical protein [uncultured Methylobacterium sp.]|uniref:hypothetical protein n=1 Tax=uncultured Methylobacterium sp. TaxID=157278 RepID=UPI0035C9C5B0